MGEDTCIYVNKKDLIKVDYLTAMKIERFFSGRWYNFKEKFHLSDEDYPNENYFTPKDIIKIIAGKKVKEEFVQVIIDLEDLDCIIQGDYADFPKDKNEDDYVDLTSIFSRLWEERVCLKQKEKVE